MFACMYHSGLPRPAISLICHTFLSSAHVYSSCVAWSCDETECWWCTKAWRPNWSTWTWWHSSFTKPTSDESQAWRQWGQTILDLEMCSNVHCSSDCDLHYLAGYCSCLWRILGNPPHYLAVSVWKWRSSGFERWSKFYFFDGEHRPSWLSSHVAVPHCTDCTHPLGSKFLVPQLGGRLGDTKLNHSYEENIHHARRSIEAKCGRHSRNVEGVPPAMRVSWNAIYHSKSIAESLASIEPTRMQSVAGSVPADGSCHVFPLLLEQLPGTNVGRDFCVQDQGCEFCCVCDRIIGRSLHTNFRYLLLNLECADNSDTVSCHLDIP